MHLNQYKRNPEKRRNSATRLPSINKSKYYINSSNRKITSPIVLGQLKHENSQKKIHHRHSSSAKKSNMISKKGASFVIGELSKGKNDLSSYRLRTQIIAGQPNNKSMLQNFEMQKEDGGNTLQNFRKYIRKNREHIHSEINKRKKILSQHPTPQQNFTSSTQKKQVKQKKNKKYTLADEDSQIFIEIKKIMKNKIQSSQESHNKIDLNQVQHSVKLAKLIRNIHKLNPQKSISQLRVSFEQEKSKSSNQSPQVLKDEQNYHEWRRVELDNNKQSPNYKKSTFELENQRLQNYILKNQIVLSKYLENKNQLFNIKSSSKNKNKTSIC